MTDPTSAMVHNDMDSNNGSVRDSDAGGGADGGGGDGGGGGGDLVVAIDGPSGTGKSSVSRAVAQRLHAAYLDTGAMYRALTWAVLRDGIDVGDPDELARYAAAAPLEVGMDPGAPTIGVGGVDVSRAIREDRVTEAVSRVATNLAVRADQCARQRALIAAGLRSHGAVVAEGRDITTVVASDARVRILLTASEEARLTRRARQLTGRSDEAARTAQRDKVVNRDALDSTVSQFTTAADGVVTLDSSELTFEQSVTAVLELVCGPPSDPGGTAERPG
jgi:cytidylate kinase